MQIKTAGVTVHFEQYGNANAPQLLMLHGWGCSLHHFDPIIHAMEDTFHITAVDFPAHGESTRPSEPWGVADFSECIREVITQLNIVPCDIIAHSFGGRVALYLASNHPDLVHRLVLTGCAGLKAAPTAEGKRRSARYRNLKKLYTSIGKIKPLRPVMDKYLSALRTRYGSADYNALDDEMKKTFVKIVSEDLASLLPRIRASTLLIWGENDQETPLWMGKKMETEIPDAGLAVFEGDDHFAYLRQWPRFVAVVRTFLEQ